MNLIDENNIDEYIRKAYLLINNEKVGEASKILESIYGDVYLQDRLTPAHWSDIGNLSLACRKLEFAKIAFLYSHEYDHVAFAMILQEKYKEALNYLKRSKDSPFVRWNYFLIDALMPVTFMKNWPTFLQIRNYMEVTVYYLIVLNKEHKVKNILSKLSKLEAINVDTLKFVGYAYLHAHCCDLAIDMLNQAIQKNQMDGELHFFLSHAYIEKKEFSLALGALENAKLLMPNHYPTKKTINEVQKMLQ